MVTQPPIRRGRIRHLLRKLFFVIAFNLPVIVALDLVAGAWWSDRVFPDELHLVKHPVLGCIPKPEHSSLVAFEKRLAHNDLRTPSNTRHRIVVVGDSHTEGVSEKQDTYSSQLRDRLTQRDGVPIEVINAGVARYSPYQCYLRLKHDLVKFSPDLVIVALYVGNDLLDMLRIDDRPSMTLRGQHIVERSPQFLVFNDVPLRPWLSRSFLYRAYRHRIKYSIDRIRVVHGIVGSVGGDLWDTWHVLTPFFKVMNRGIISQSLMQTLIFAKYPRARTDAFQLVDHVIGLHLDLAAEHRYELEFLLIPSRIQIEANLEQQKIVEAFQVSGLTVRDMQMDDMLYDDLYQLLRSKGVYVTDPRDQLREASSASTPMYWTDYHINANGAAVVADALCDHLLNGPAHSRFKER